MADQMRKDQSGGGQATGQKVPAQAAVTTKTTEGQSDNGTGSGTRPPKLERIPGVR